MFIYLSMNVYIYINNTYYIIYAYLSPNIYEPLRVREFLQSWQEEKALEDEVRKLQKVPIDKLCVPFFFFQSNFLVCVCWMEHIYIYIWTTPYLYIYIYTHYICNILSMLFFCCSDQLVHRKINPQRPIIQSFGGCRCHCGARLQRRPPRRSLLRIIQWLVGQCTWSSCSVIFDT